MIENFFKVTIKIFLFLYNTNLFPKDSFRPLVSDLTII